MLQNAKVTAFTVFELLRENQLGGRGITPHPHPPRLGLKKTRENTDNSSIRIYVNKIENTITFKSKTRYLDLLKPKTIKLLRSTQNKIINDKNSKNVPHLQIN